MQYKVIPFTANVGRNSNTDNVATQLQNAIESIAKDGWKYEQMESVETQVAGSKGCFGIGVQEGTVTSIKVLVFSKS
jgi:hypothetical protein